VTAKSENIFFFMISKGIKIKILIVSCFVTMVNCYLDGQSFFGFTAEGPNQVALRKLNNSQLCQEFCNTEYIGGPYAELFNVNISMGADGNVYGLASTDEIFLFDTLTGLFTIFHDFQNNLILGIDFVCTGPGVFYTFIEENFTGFLYELNVNNGNVINLGQTPYIIAGDMTLFDGEVYMQAKISIQPSNYAIMKVDLSNPGNSVIVFDFPDNYFFYAITASDKCNTLIGADFNTKVLYEINLIEHTIVPLCDLSDKFTALTSMREFATPDCTPKLELDCDDSSGASIANFNGDAYSCLSPGVVISDIDNNIIADTWIDAMTIQVAGSVPDGSNEILDYSGNVSGINVSGDGTGTLTLTNSGGATSRDFLDALLLVRYKNLAVPLTPGPRTIEVQFTTESGAQSNIATAFIDVIALPLVDVDLGADQQACDGASVTFNAGHPGASFEWSTGVDTQSITVDESGEYVVTVSDGINCPGRDTVELDILPVINVSLTGDTEICDNEPANLLINTDAPFPLIIEIGAEPGNPFSFPDVSGNLTFTDLPTESTTYTITSVTPSQEACITITDPDQFIDVYPSYILAVDVTLCDGDSIWLGYYYESEEGEYENTFNTIEGCDSVVTTTIIILPAISIAQQSTTCDTSAAGIFFEYLDNPNGCDTVIQTTVTYLPPDTTMITKLTCNSDSVGITTLLLTNQSGCDSVIITTTTVTPPQDTTFLFQMTCDSSLLGITQNTETNQAGCDSLIITTTSIAPSDTTYLNGISCDSASLGAIYYATKGSDGCDSIVITTIVAGIPDTTYLFSTSCDSASLGVSETHYTTAQQCDSLVITTVTYSAQDSTFINSSSCDPAEVGVFIQALINSFGCDSIVTETITLLPSNATAINSTTCDPGQTGIFTNTLINQYGCDSIVTETITLLPSDATFLTGTTCKSSEAGMFITTHLNQYGCDSIVTLTVTLIPSDTTLLSFKTCDPTHVGNIENLYIGQDGCDSLVIESTSLFPLPQLDLMVTSDFSGYGISCFGEHDGSIEAATAGEDPFQYSWSTGDTTQSITGLGAGDYDVLISDAKGCMASGSITLNQPEAFSIGFEVSQPDCFTNEVGNITVLQSGGVLPVRYSKDGINYQSSPIYTDLSAGSYTITALDANDCEAKEIILINVAIDVDVNLGVDQIIMPGDTSTIEALVNVPYDSLASITWSGLMNPNCPTCLTQFVAPIITTAYTVSVSNAQGCTDLDSMIVFVQRNIDIYVPNVFSPNGDGINDHLLISAGADVEEIEAFTIFDRWGNMIYLNEHFLPNDPSEGWDGKRKGVALNHGVYAYKMMAKFADGRSEIRYGDVTLLR
jgi:gliding motility-associated-like protein